jgi:hypothetical protein
MKVKPDDALTQKIISRLAKEDFATRDEKFIPHPATWLNDQRWNDETMVSNTPNFPFGKRIL